jgi:SSS family solute:Na+ symporter
LSTLVVGLVVAFLRIGLELASDSLDPDGIIYALAKANFLTFAAWFFLFSVILCVAISLMTPPPTPAQIQGLTYGSLTEEQKLANKNSYNFWDIALSLGVIAIVVYVMVSFTG